MAGKRYREVVAKIDRTRNYPLEEALKFLVENPTAKFDETIELAVRLNVDPRQADQNVRGSVSYRTEPAETCACWCLPRARRKRKRRPRVLITSAEKSLLRKSRRRTGSSSIGLSLRPTSWAPWGESVRFSVRGV